MIDADCKKREKKKRQPFLENIKKQLIFIHIEMKFNEQKKRSTLLSQFGYKG